VFRLILSPANVSETSVTLDAETAHYLQRVLRVRPKDKGQLVLKDKAVLDISVKAFNKNSLTFDLLSESPLPTPDYPLITLAQCLPKQDKMSSILKACTECGVSTFIPLISDRCVPQLTPNKETIRLKRWQTIIHSASLQSQQWAIPTLHPIQSLKDLGNHFETTDYDLKLVPWEEEGLQSSIKSVLASVKSPPKRVFILIGPEGGLTNEEVSFLKSLGCKGVSLGRSILRVEHAGLLACGFSKDSQKPSKTS